MRVSFVCKSFAELTKIELYEILHLRSLVFVVGQRITAEPEVDGDDPSYHHLMGRDEEHRIVAAARLGFGCEPVKVGRVGVRTELQRRGIGGQLMRAVHESIGDRPAEMHAQAYLESWYASLGWQREGENFVEAEIDHVRMIRRALSRPLKHGGQGAG